MQQAHGGTRPKRKLEETLSSGGLMELEATRAHGWSAGQGRSVHGAAGAGSLAPPKPALDENESTATLLPDAVSVSGLDARGAADEPRTRQQHNNSDPARRGAPVTERPQELLKSAAPAYTQASAVSLWGDAELDDADFADSFSPAPVVPQAPAAPPRVARKEVRLEPGQSKLRSVLEGDQTAMRHQGGAKVAGAFGGPGAGGSPLRIDTRGASSAPSASAPHSAPSKQYRNDLPPLPGSDERTFAEARRDIQTQPSSVPPNPVARSGSDTMVERKRSGYVGPYKLDRVLGSGSVGKVHLGIHKDTGHRVAIKVVPKEDKHAADERKPAQPPKPRRDNREKLEREVAIMKLIKHPNVLELYDVYETENHLYLVLELVEGGELFDYLVQRGRLPEQEALRFFQQIIGGLSYCHSHLVCHRDLKPENLLLDPSGHNVKIADFGMANLQIPSRLLQTSCGSPHYASPEVIRGIQYDGALADIWSCGVILYALLTGGLPFDDPDIKKLLAKVKTGAYVLPGRDICSSACQDLLSRMLTVDPAQRIQMNDILRHPFFVSRPPSPLSVFPSSLKSHSWTDRFAFDQIDRELLRQLSILGWGTPAQIEARLTSEEPCLDKAFYTLLQQRQRAARLFRESSRGSISKGHGRGTSSRTLPAPQPSPPIEESTASLSAARRQLPPKIAIPTAEERASYSQIQGYEGTTPRFHRPVKPSVSSLASETSASLVSAVSPKRSWFANFLFGSGSSNNGGKTYGSDFHPSNFSHSASSASSASDADSLISDFSTSAPENLLDAISEYPTTIISPGIDGGSRIWPPSSLSIDRVSGDVEQLLRERRVQVDHVSQLDALLCAVDTAVFGGRTSYDGNGDVRMNDSADMGPLAAPATFVIRVGLAPASESGSPSYIGGWPEEQDERDRRVFVDVVARSESSRAFAESICRDLRIRWNLRKPVSEEEAAKRSTSMRSTGSKLGRELRRLVNVGREIIGQGAQ